MRWITIAGWIAAAALFWRADHLQGELSLAESQRDTAAADAVGAIKATTGWIGVAHRRAELLAECQDESERVRIAGDKAVEQARAAARDADRTLAAFIAQFERRPLQCEQALIAMEAACPALSPY